MAGPSLQRYSATASTGRRSRPGAGVTRPTSRSWPVASRRARSLYDVPGWTRCRRRTHARPHRGSVPRRVVVAVRRDAVARIDAAPYRTVARSRNNGRDRCCRRLLVDGVRSLASGVRSRSWHRGHRGRDRALRTTIGPGASMPERPGRSWHSDRPIGATPLAVYQGRSAHWCAAIATVRTVRRRLRARSRAPDRPAAGAFRAGGQPAAARDAVDHLLAAAGGDAALRGEGGDPGRQLVGADDGTGGRAGDVRVTTDHRGIDLDDEVRVVVGEPASDALAVPDRPRQRIVHLGPAALGPDEPVPVLDAHGTGGRERTDDGGTERADDEVRDRTPVVAG